MLVEIIFLLFFFSNFKWIFQIYAALCVIEGMNHVECIEKCNKNCTQLKNYTFLKQFVSIFISAELKTSWKMQLTIRALLIYFKSTRKSLTLHPFRTNKVVYCACGIWMRITSRCSSCRKCSSCGNQRRITRRGINMTFYQAFYSSIERRHMSVSGDFSDCRLKK